MTTGQHISQHFQFKGIYHQPFLFEDIWKHLPRTMYADLYSLQQLRSLLPIAKEFCMRYKRKCNRLSVRTYA